MQELGQRIDLIVVLLVGKAQQFGAQFGQPVGGFWQQDQACLELAALRLDAGVFVQRRLIEPELVPQLYSRRNS